MPIAGPPLDGPFPLAEILKQGLDTKPDADALVSRRRRWTWRALDSVSTRLAGNYLDLGLAPGDRIASLMPNRTELMVHYLACMKCGLVAVPLNYRYMAPEIDHALEVSEAKALLAHDERREDLAASTLAGKLPLGRIGYDDDDGGGHPRPQRPELRVADGRRSEPRCRPAEAGRPGDHLLHVGQHRQAEGRLPQLRDAGLDHRQCRRAMGTDVRRHHAARWVGFPRGRPPLVDDDARGRRPGGHGAHLRWRRNPAAVARRTADQDVDASVGALCPGSRSRRPPRGFRLGRGVLFRRRQGFRGPRGGVHRACRHRDQRGSTG